MRNFTSLRSLEKARLDDAAEFLSVVALALTSNFSHPALASVTLGAIKAAKTQIARYPELAADQLDAVRRVLDMQLPEPDECLQLFYISGHHYDGRPKYTAMNIRTLKRNDPRWCFVDDPHPACPDILRHRLKEAWTNRFWGKPDFKETFLVELLRDTPAATDGMAEAPVEQSQLEEMLDQAMAFVDPGKPLPPPQFFWGVPPTS